ncbi:MAG: hypothetical protein HY319_05175 [Armatimonadetes bacterium]|nr:hypothetical protein [Armatimonadota bacterium]
MREGESTACRSSGRQDAPVWTPEDRLRLENLFENRLRRLQVLWRPDYAAERVRAFLAERESGYLPVRGQSGAGKSFLVSYLRGILPQGWLAVDCREDDLLLGLPQAGTPALPGVAPRDRLRVQLARWVRENGRPLVLLLDHLEERWAPVMERLPVELPRGVYVLLLYDPSWMPSMGLVDRGLDERLVGLTGTPPLELSQRHPEYRQTVEAFLASHPGGARLSVSERERILARCSYNLLYVRYGADALRTGLYNEDTLPPPASFYSDLLPRLGNRELWDLVVLLALHDAPAPPELVEELIEPGTLAQLLSLLPAALRADPEGLSLGHRSLRGFVLEQLGPQVPGQARRLVRWITTRAGQLTTEELARLYRIAAHDPGLALEVAGSEVLNGNRESLVDSLESPRRAGLLTAWQGCMHHAGPIQELRESWARCHQSRGRIYLELARPEQAADDLGAAVDAFEELDRSGDLASAHTERAEALRQLGRSREGMSHLSRAIVLLAAADAPVLARAHHARALLALECGELGEAWEDCSAAIRLSQDEEAPYRHTCGRIELAMGRVEDAEASLRRCLELPGGSLEAALDLCRISRRRDRPSEALAAAQRAVEKGARGEEKRREALAEAYLERARSRFEPDSSPRILRDCDKAIGLLEELVLEEHRVDLRLSLARALEHRAERLSGLERREEALADLVRAGDLYTQLLHLAALGETRGAQVALLLELGREADAQDTCHAVAEVLAKAEGPGLARAHSRLGDAWRRCGLYGAASEHYAQAIELMEKQPEPDLDLELARAFQNRALAALESQEPARAARDGERALDLLSALLDQKELEVVVPRLASVCCTQGTALARLGSVREALKAFGTGIKLYRSLVEQGREFQGELACAHRDRASVQLQVGRQVDALEDCNEAVRRLERMGDGWADELARTRLVRSQVRTQARKYREALADLGAAIDHFASRGGRLEGLVAALWQTAQNASEAGDLRAAIEVHTRILELGSSRIETARSHLERGILWRKLGDRERALPDLSEAVALYRALQSQDDRKDLAAVVAQAHAELGRSLLGLGKPEQAVEQFSGSIDMLGTLVQQDQARYKRELAARYRERGTAQEAARRLWKAADDMGSAIALELAMARDGSAGTEALAEIGSSLATRAALLTRLGDRRKAVQDYDTGVEILSRLVAQEGRQELRGVLAQTLLARSHLSDEDESLPWVVRAVGALRGAEVLPAGFAEEALGAAVGALSRVDGPGRELAESVLALLEEGIGGGGDPTRVTELLLELVGLLSAPELRVRATILCCLSCEREVREHGPDRLTRLAYCLRLTAEGLSLAPTGLPLPATMGELARAFVLLRDAAAAGLAPPEAVAEFRMGVSRWRTLPPEMPARAGISRSLLASLLGRSGEGPGRA